METLDSFHIVSSQVESDEVGRRSRGSVIIRVVRYATITENGQHHPFDHLAFNPHIYIILDSWYCCWYLHNCPSLHSLYRSVIGSHRFLAVSSTIPEILCSRDDGGKRT